jgi:hypothetical protein
MNNTFKFLSHENFDIPLVIYEICYLDNQIVQLIGQPSLSYSHYERE